MAIPGAVTVVPVDAFGRTIDPRSVRRIDQQTLASVRPTLDPLTLTPLRNAVLNSAWGRGKIDLPPGIAKKLNDTRVVVSTAPVAPSYRKDLAKALRAEPVPAEAKNQKLKLKDERNGEAAQQPDAARKQQIDAQAGEAARGNKDAKDAGGLGRAVGKARIDVPKQPQAQEQAQRKAAPPAQRQAAPQAQAVRVGHPAKAVAAPQPAKARAQPEAPRKAAPQAQAVRVGHPAKAAAAPQAAKSAPAPQPAKQRAQPQAARKAAAAPQPVKQEAKPAGAAKQERKPPPAQATEGKGKGKEKHP
jgi:hypothetical protein